MRDRRRRRRRLDRRRTRTRPPTASSEARSRASAGRRASAPGARTLKSVERLRPVTTRSRKTPVATSCVPGGRADDDRGDVAEPREQARCSPRGSSRRPPARGAPGSPRAGRRMMISAISDRRRPSAARDQIISPRRRTQLQDLGADELSFVALQPRGDREERLLERGAGGLEPRHGDARADERAVDARPGARPSASVRRGARAPSSSTLRDRGVAAEHAARGLRGRRPSISTVGSPLAAISVDRALHDDAAAGRRSRPGRRSSRPRRAGARRGTRCGPRRRTRGSGGASRGCPAGSRPFIGSSRISSAGSASRQRAMPSRWRMPSE